MSGQSPPKMPGKTPEGMGKWTIRRAALLGAACFFGAVIWRGMTLETSTAERAVDGAIWALVAVLAVYALGVSAEQLIVLIKTVKGPHN